jgi:transposase-like protein
MVLDHEGDHSSRWAAVTSVAEKIDCSGHTLLEWVKKAEMDNGIRTSMPKNGIETDHRRLRGLTARCDAGR